MSERDNGILKNKFYFDYTFINTAHSKRDKKNFRIRDSIIFISLIFTFNGISFYLNKLRNRLHIIK